MARRNRCHEITDAVKAYIENAEEKSPDESPLDVKRVAAELRLSRTTLYNYGLDKLIAEGAERQRARADQVKGGDKRSAERAMIQRLRAELAQAVEQNKQLMARLCLVEANAVNLNIDPEHLYRVIPKPDCTTSFAGRENKCDTHRR